MNCNMEYTLYLCTDRNIMTTHTIEESVELAIQGGVTVVQLREKDVSSREFYQIAQSVKQVTQKYAIPLLINDRVDIAMAVNADGVHVGQNDLPCSVVRRMLGKDKIIGVSASTLAEAIQAEREGADYLGIGAMYATSTKTDAKSVSLETLRQIHDTVKIPIVAIGGIHVGNALELRSIGIEGIAVISAILGKTDISGAARELKKVMVDKLENMPYNKEK